MGTATVFSIYIEPYSRTGWVKIRGIAAQDWKIENPISLPKERFWGLLLKILL